MTSPAPIDSLWAVVPPGGAGTRLWPLSRATAPKFLHDLRGSGRKDPTVEVRLRRVEPQGDGVDRPVVLATAVRDWATGDVTVSVNAKW